MYVIIVVKTATTTYNNYPLSFVMGATHRLWSTWVSDPTCNSRNNLGQYDWPGVLRCEPVDGVLVVLSSNQINITMFVHQMGDAHISTYDVTVISCHISPPPEHALGMRGMFHRDDLRLWDFQSDWVPILYASRIRLTPLSAEKIGVSLSHLVLEILAPTFGLIFQQNVLFI